VCLDNDYIGRDPARSKRLNPPRREVTHRKARPISQVRQLIDSQPELCDRLALKLSAMLGLRRGAVRGIRIRDFDLAAGTVRATSKGSKTKDHQLVYEELRLDVEQLILEGWEPDWYLLHVRRSLNLPGREEVRAYPTKQLSNTGFTRWLHKRFEYCLDIVPHDFHTLRTTAVTRIYRKSGNDIKAAQELAGHASAQTTLDHYIDHSEIEQIAAMKKAAWGADE
jgi:integrase